MFQSALCCRGFTDFSDCPIPACVDDTFDQYTILLLCQCVSPKDYKELADLYFDGKTETVVKKLEKVIYAFAWGFNSLISHLKFYLNEDKLPNVFKSLTSFVTHGVSTTAAVYAISLGVNDRQIAIALSSSYQATFPETEYSHFKQWLFNLSFEQWKEILQVEDDNNGKIESCFNDVQNKQRKLGKNSTIFTYSLTSVKNLMTNHENINENDLILVNCNDNWLF